MSSTSSSTIVILEHCRPMPDLLKEYQMVKRLGFGGFGKVYLLRSKTTKELRAAKHQEWGNQDKNYQQVRREVYILTKLQKKQNEHIVRFFDYYEGDQQSVILTEYLSGGELFERISSPNYILTEAKCRDFAIQIFKGVNFIHQSKIIHLDLKPQNIVLQTARPFSAGVGGVGSPHRRLSDLPTMDKYLDKRRMSDTEQFPERLKIIDFGLARDLSRTRTDSIPISICGTVEFMAPEVLNCTRASYSTDMWSVGVILYMMLSGGLSPFWAGNAFRTQRRITRALLVNGGFSQPEFKKVSTEAIDCVQNLLKIRKEDRLTADECLDHPWLTKSYLETLKNLETLGIRRYLARRRWIRWFNAIRAMNRMKKVLGNNVDFIDGIRSSPLVYDSFRFKNRHFF